MKTYIFIGDSYTERMNKQGLIPSRHIVLAKHGTAPRDWYDQTDNEKYVDFQTELNAIPPDSIDGIVYLYGINDIKCSWNIRYAKRQLSDLLRMFPEKPIYVQRVFPVPTKYSWTKHTYKQMNILGPCNVKTYNEQLKDFCASNDNLHWIDSTGGFITSYGNMKAECSDDGLHINEKYYPKFWKNICKNVPEVE